MPGCWCALCWSVLPVREPFQASLHPQEAVWYPQFEVLTDCEGEFTQTQGRKVRREVADDIQSYPDPLHQTDVLRPRTAAAMVSSSPKTPTLRYIPAPASQPFHPDPLRVLGSPRARAPGTRGLFNCRSVQRVVLREAPVGGGISQVRIANLLEHGELYTATRRVYGLRDLARYPKCPMCKGP